MVPVLSYTRFPYFYQNGFYDQKFIEGVIYHVPSFQYPYHIFILQDGKQIQKHYRRTASAALKVLKTKTAGVKKKRYD